MSLWPPTSSLFHSLVDSYTYTEQRLKLFKYLTTRAAACGALESIRVILEIFPEDAHMVHLLKLLEPLADYASGLVNHLDADSIERKVHMWSSTSPITVRAPHISSYYTRLASATQNVLLDIRAGSIRYIQGSHNNLRTLLTQTRYVSDALPLTDEVRQPLKERLSGFFWTSIGTGGLFPVKSTREPHRYSGYLYHEILPFQDEWKTDTAIALAKGIVKELAFDRMPILADVLFEVGLQYDFILGHLRNDPVTKFSRADWVLWNLLTESKLES